MAVPERAGNFDDTVESTTIFHTNRDNIATLDPDSRRDDKKCSHLNRGGHQGGLYASRKW